MTSLRATVADGAMDTRARSRRGEGIPATMTAMAPPRSPAAPASVRADRSARSGAEQRKFNAEELGQRLLRLLAPLRVQSLSLHNAEAELLWLSEGVFGPDEHGYVQDALDLFALETQRSHLERKLEDGRRAVFICARTPMGDRCGLAFAVAESRSSSQAIDGELGTPRVTAVMQRFSTLLAPPLSPQRAGSEKAAVAPRQPPSASARSHTAAALQARRYARLRAGGATRRYEIAGAVPASMPEDIALTRRVVEHLQREDARYQQKPSTFAIPLSAESVMSGTFLDQATSAAAVATTSNGAALREGILGFCLPCEAWSNELAATERFIAQCADRGYFVALDDFNLGRSGFSLLRSSALRCLKLEAGLIATVMNDKFSQATVAAIVHAARVLGLYCVAKAVESPRLGQWLAGAGIEFADGLSRGETALATTKDAELVTLQAPS